MSVAARAEALIESGEIYSEVHKNLARTLLIMSDSLIVHARNGAIEPQYLARDLERLESVMHSLEATGKVKSDLASDANQVVIPILREAMEELGEQPFDSSDVSQTGKVCVYRIDA